MLSRKLLLALFLFIAMIALRSHLYPVIQQLSSYLVYPIIYIHHLVVDPYKSHDQSSLQQAYDDLLSAHIQLQATADYYDDIEELIAFKKRYHTDYDHDQHDHTIIAQVLQRYMGDDEQYLLIDKGSRDGVHDRMVLVFKDMLVGRVHQVFPLYSKCLLVTDERCKIGAYCAQSKAQGVTKGCNSADRISLKYVSHLAAMQRHDLIISSGEGLIFPRGFGIARVTDFAKDDLLYRISGEPLIDVAALRYCYLIEKS